MEFQFLVNNHIFNFQPLELEGSTILYLKALNILYGVPPLYLSLWEVHPSPFQHASKKTEFNDVPKYFCLFIVITSFKQTTEPFSLSKEMQMEEVKVKEVMQVECSHYPWSNGCTEIGCTFQNGENSYHFQPHGLLYFIHNMTN